MVHTFSTHEVNIIVWNDHVQPGDKASLFLDEPVIHIEPGEMDVIDLLVAMGVFPSRGQARKNWRGPQEIPSGFSDFEGIGKMRRRLTIWNPST